MLFSASAVRPFAHCGHPALQWGTDTTRASIQMSDSICFILPRPQILVKCHREKESNLCIVSELWEEYVKKMNNLKNMMEFCFVPCYNKRNLRFLREDIFRERI